MASKEKTCSVPGCDRPPRYGQRYCGPCHAAYMRAYRASEKRRIKMMSAEVERLRRRYVEAQQRIAELEVALDER